MRHTIGNESMETLSEITLSVLSKEEEEIDLDAAMAKRMETRLDGIRLRRAEAHMRVDEIHRQGRMADAELSILEEELDKEQSELCGLLIRLKARRLENAQEKHEAVLAVKRAGFGYVHPSLLEKVGVTP